MRKVILVGNPNVGRSLPFSRITRTGVDTANYAGTTVSLNVGRLVFGEEEFELVDGPGVYSVEEFSEADAAALRLIAESDASKGDIIIVFVAAVLGATGLHWACVLLRL
jgi:ferrous iron transport protein B